MSTPADWYATERGAYVLAWERTQFNSAVEDVFGFVAIQIGAQRPDFLATNRIPLRACIDVGAGGCVQAVADALPIASQSVDLIVLPHVLEFSASPHQILREAERVLRPEGRIVISGFNPLSLWGVRRVLSRRRGYPWNGEFIGLLRLRDWLKLLGFELDGGRFGCYAPPFGRSTWLQRSAFMEKAGDRWWPIAGGVYVVRGVKRVHGMRLVRPAWKNGKATTKALTPLPQRRSHGARRESDE